MAPACQPQWARVEQNKFPHDSVASLEHGPMRTEFVDRPHPLLFGRIVWVVGNLLNRVDPTQRRLYVLAMLLLGHHPQLSIRPQTRRWNRSNLSIEGSFCEGFRHDGCPPLFLPTYRSKGKSEMRFTPRHVSSRLTRSARSPR